MYMYLYIGANKYTYWVARSTTASVEDWVKLPNVKMAHVVISRQFKRFLTGKWCVLCMLFVCVGGGGVVVVIVIFFNFTCVIR